MDAYAYVLMKLPSAGGNGQPDVHDSENTSSVAIQRLHLTQF